MSQNERPFLSLCLATSLDGKISAKAGAPPDFTSRYDLEKLFRLRSQADALLVGANTVRQETLPPLVRKPEFAAARQDAGKPAHPAVVIISRSLDLPWDSRYFREAKQEIFILSAAVSPEQQARITAAGARLIHTGADIDLAAGLTRLAEMGFKRILGEGGGRLNQGLLAADLVDYLYLTIAPIFIGGLDTPGLCQGPTLEPPVRFELVSQSLVHGEMHMEYQRIARDRA